MIGDDEAGDDDSGMMRPLLWPTYFGGHTIYTVYGNIRVELTWLCALPGFTDQALDMKDSVLKFKGCSVAGAVQLAIHFLASPRTAAEEGSCSTFCDLQTANICAKCQQSPQQSSLLSFLQAKGQKELFSLQNLRGIEAMNLMGLCILVDISKKSFVKINYSMQQNFSKAEYYSPKYSLVKKVLVQICFEDWSKREQIMVT